MEKKKLLKRLSALGFAMYECRLYCDTHPNDTEALQMLNDYKSKYEAVKDEELPLGVTELTTVFVGS